MENSAQLILIKLVKHYESLHDGDLKSIGLQPKMCPAGYWTEGYGQVVTDANGKMIKGEANKELAYKHSKIKTEAQAVEALQKALNAREVVVCRYLKQDNIVVTDLEKAACVSLAYNIGLGAFKGSSLYSQLKKGFKTPQERKEIDECFRTWNKGGGKVLPGLVKRRTSESYLFLLHELNIF